MIKGKNKVIVVWYRKVQIIWAHVLKGNFLQKDKRQRKYYMAKL